MSEGIEEIFKLCDSMFESVTIDFEELKSKEIASNFFDNYNNLNLVSKMERQYKKIIKGFFVSILMDYEKISSSEKFTLLEELWVNMTNEATKNGFTPKWHVDELKIREKNILDKKSSFGDLEDAKKRLQRIAL